MSGAPPLQFEPLQCRVEVQFWFELERRKLHEYKDSVPVGMLDHRRLRRFPAHPVCRQEDYSATFVQ